MKDVYIIMDVHLGLVMSDPDNNDLKASSWLSVCLEVFGDSNLLVCVRKEALGKLILLLLSSVVYGFALFVMFMFRRRKD